MIELEDSGPRRSRPKPRDLQPLSVEELRAYIADLDGEIVRAEAAITAKEAHKTGLDTLFGGPIED